MTTRKELIEALQARYRSAAFSDRIKILDEFVALTCYHRKHAIRVLRGEFSPATVVRLRNRVYGEAVAQALTVLWEAANWVHVGRTTGRGKKSAVHRQIIPIKDIWLYPLQTDFAAVLCR